MYSVYIQYSQNLRPPTKMLINCVLCTYKLMTVMDFDPQLHDLNTTDHYVAHLKAEKAKHLDKTDPKMFGNVLTFSSFTSNFKLI